MDKFVKLKDLVASLEVDAEKFFNNGNSKAGTRVRQGLQDVKALAQELRLDISAAKTAAKAAK